MAIHFSCYCLHGHFCGYPYSCCGYPLFVLSSSWTFLWLSIFRVIVFMDIFVAFYFHRPKKLIGLQCLSLVVRKPVFGVSDQVRYKPGCTATEDGRKLEISDIGRRGIEKLNI